MRAIVVVLLVLGISGCASMQRLADRLCGIEVIHATFCDGQPEAPDAE
jgi:uncharacterized protein YceK